MAPVIFFPLQENKLRAWGTNLGGGWLVESGEDAEALAAAGANRVARRSAPLTCGGKVLGFRVWGGWRQGEVLGLRVWRGAIGGRDWSLMSWRWCRRRRWCSAKCASEGESRRPNELDLCIPFVLGNFTRSKVVVTSIVIFIELPKFFFEKFGSIVP